MDIYKIQMVDLKRQYLKIKQEIDLAIQQVFDSTAFINGPEVKRFSQDLAQYLDVPYVVTCANGTDALQVASMVFTNVINPRSAVNRRGQYSKTIVKRGASIGANVTIICGNDIGEFAFLGAGVVITKDVTPYSLIVGNPARQIGWMSEYGHRLSFDKSGFAFCPESNEKYELKNGLVKKL